MSSPQTLAGATQFDGTAGKGLETFGDVPSDEYEAYITGLSYYTGGATTNLLITLEGAAASERMTIKDAALTDWSLLDVEIPVPLDSNGDPYQLKCVTTGKDAAATFTYTHEYRFRRQ
jgi:hypothetical protein